MKLLTNPLQFSKIIRTTYNPLRGVKLIQKIADWYYACWNVALCFCLKNLIKNTTKVKHVLLKISYVLQSANIVHSVFDLFFCITTCYWFGLLFRFLLINATMIKTKWRMEPLCSGNPGFFKVLWLLSWQQHFLHNNVFMTLVPAGGLLANMGGQDSLRQRQNTHSAIYLQEQKTRFLALIVFIFYFIFPRLLCYQNANRLRCP